MSDAAPRRQPRQSREYLTAADVVRRARSSSGHPSIQDYQDSNLELHTTPDEDYSDPHVEPHINPPLGDLPTRALRAGVSKKKKKNKKKIDIDHSSSSSSSPDARAKRDLKFRSDRQIAEHLRTAWKVRTPTALMRTAGRETVLAVLARLADSDLSGTRDLGAYVARCILNEAQERLFAEDDA